MSSQPNETPASPPAPCPRTVEEIAANALAFANERAAAREARRARFAQTRPVPKLCLVAWIDLLGFREQISNAITPEKFQAAYRRMREVQEEFDLDSASAEPDQAQLNEMMGKKMVALSDGIVIALNLEGDSPAAAIHSHHERIGMFLEDFRSA